MGSGDSEVTAATTDLFIEVANFDPARVRSARRALGMSSDAAYRFERGVDVEVAPKALERVAQLVIALAGGSVEGSPIDLRSTDPVVTQIALRTSRVSQVLGADIDAEAIDRHLSGIGFTVRRGDKEHAGATVPSWRGDVTAEIDLIEEIARLHGYDAFPAEIRPFRPGTVPDDPQWVRARRIRELLVGRGLFEIRPTPFVAGGDAHVRVSNPLAKDEAHLRRSVIESLAKRAEFNVAHMQRDIRLFEIGDVFRSSGSLMPREELHVGILVMGRRAPRHFTDLHSEDFERWADFDRWDVAALARDVAKLAHEGGVLTMQPAGTDSSGVDSHPLVPEWVIVRPDGVPVAGVGRVPLDAPVWAPPAWGFELYVGEVDSAEVAPRGRHSYAETPVETKVRRSFRPLPVTPAVEFDVALLLGPGRTAAEVEKVIRASAGELLERLELFDQYTGDGIGIGMRSVAWRLTFRHPERTLRDKEIDGRRARILSDLDKELNVRPRTS